MSTFVVPIEGRVAEFGSATCAMVEAADRNAASDLVVQAVDVLRVLQHVRHFTMELTQFGIAGDVSNGVVSYLNLDPSQSWSGSFRRGNAVGWSFKDPDEWLNAPVFQWVASTIDASTPSESQRRALIGIQLFSQALVEQRGTFKMVELVSALEAWLLPERGAGTNVPFGQGGRLLRLRPPGWRPLRQITGYQWLPSMQRLLHCLPHRIGREARQT